MIFIYLNRSIITQPGLITDIIFRNTLSVVNLLQPIFKIRTEHLCAYLGFFLKRKINETVTQSNISNLKCIFFGHSISKW